MNPAEYLAELQTWLVTSATVELFTILSISVDEWQADTTVPALG